MSTEYEEWKLLGSGYPKQTIVSGEYLSYALQCVVFASLAPYRDDFDCRYFPYEGGHEEMVSVAEVWELAGAIARSTIQYLRDHVKI